jgi:cytochrome c-type biogenesis protein CcsB
MSYVPSLANEASLVNGAFLLLLLQSILRWSQPTIIPRFQQSAAIEGNANTSAGTQPITYWLDRVVLVFLSVARIWRWIEVQHVPISNLYESLVFLSFLLASALLVLQDQGAPQAVVARAGRCPLLVLGFASFCLPPELQAAGPLVPALKSNWLLRHVTVRIISYAGLRLGSLRSVLWLAVSWAQGFPDQSNTPLLERLDQASYRLITFGFPFLTLGILSGAVWANETWGSYWSWDPKETWSLITWLVFATYLHTRLRKGQQGFIPATVASGGFVRVWICYLGVNLLGKGLHSYGWFAGGLSFF